MMDFSINWLAVIVSAILYFFVGWAWYSPLLFAKPWVAAMGKSPDQMKRDMQDKSRMIKGMGGSVLAALVMATALAVLLRAVHADGVGAGICWALLVGVGFIAMVTGTNALYDGRGKLWVINTGYPVVGFVVMSVVLSLWK